jgi:hypothetical protein
VKVSRESVLKILPLGFLRVHRWKSFALVQFGVIREFDELFDGAIPARLFHGHHGLRSVVFDDELIEILRNAELTALRVFLRLQSFANRV